jgi:hypothetical protein
MPPASKACLFLRSNTTVLPAPAAQSLNKIKQAYKMSLTTKLLVLVLTVTWLSGCATSPSTTAELPEYCTTANEAQLAEIHRVALATISKPPTIETVTLGHTRREGASRGAAAGAAGGVNVAADIASESDPYAPLVALLLLPVLVVGGAVGGAVVGTATGYAPDKLAEAEANTQAMINSAYLQTEVLQRVQDYGHANVDLEFIRLSSFNPESQENNQAYTDLADQSIDAVLEVELRRISFKYSLEMDARSRLVSTRTGDVLTKNKHVFKSESRSLNEWTENGAAQVSEAIQWGLTVLAEDIVDEDFSLFPRKWRHNQSAKDDSGRYITGCSSHDL